MSPPPNRLSLTILSSSMFITVSNIYQVLHNHLLNARILPSSTSLHSKSYIFWQEKQGLVRSQRKIKAFNIPSFVNWKNNLFKITWITIGRIKTKTFRLCHKGIGNLWSTCKTKAPLILNSNIFQPNSGFLLLSMKGSEALLSSAISWLPTFNSNIHNDEKILPSRDSSLTFG